MRSTLREGARGKLLDTSRAPKKHSKARGPPHARIFTCTTTIGSGLKSLRIKLFPPCRSGTIGRIAAAAKRGGIKSYTLVTAPTKKRNLTPAGLDALATRNQAKNCTSRMR